MADRSSFPGAQDEDRFGDALAGLTFWSAPSVASVPGRVTLIAALLVALVIGVVGPVSQPGVAERNVVTSVVSRNAGEVNVVSTQAYMRYYGFEPTLHMGKEAHTSYLLSLPSDDYGIGPAYMRYY